MFCKYCGTEISENVTFYPYCGRDQGRAKDIEYAEEIELEYDAEVVEDAGSETVIIEEKLIPENTNFLWSRNGRFVIVSILVILAIAAVIGLIASRNYSKNKTNPVETITESEVTAKLGDANVRAAQDAIDVVDKYLSYSSVDDLTYGSDTASDDLRNIADNLADEPDAGSEMLKELLEGYIDRIIVELDLNTKTLSNGLRIANGGETADREVIQTYRDKIADLAGLRY